MGNPTLRPTAIYHFILLSFFAVIIYTASISVVYAHDLGDVLCAAILMATTGNLAKALATIGVLTLGVGATMGKVSWGLAVIIGIGISVIFSAPLVASLLVAQYGNGAQGCGGAP